MTRRSTRGDLSRFDAIVVGPRAYETDSALVESNGRLLEYARRGGLVIVQYQQGRFFNGGFAPYPMTLAMPHDRVTDETAPVAVLTPADPVVNTPNRISEERLERLDPGARALLRAELGLGVSADPRVARPGRSSRCAEASSSPAWARGSTCTPELSFFRQLPAGVPGAFRLFANLLALARPYTP